jgi:predicted phosphodiesterase
MSDVRIGLVSDIHSMAEDGSDAPDALFRLFDGVDQIVACGDHTSAGVLERLAAVGPLVATKNPASPHDGGGYTSQHTAVLDIRGRRMGVLFTLLQLGIPVSDEGEITWPAWPLADKLAETFSGPVDALLFGGTHRVLVGAADGVLLVNPGSVRFSARTTAAVLTLHDGAGVTDVAICDV